MTRSLASLAVTLLIAVLAVNLWPSSGNDSTEPVYLDPPVEDLVVLQEITPTRQGPPRDPPPPLPLPPIPVPNDVLLSEVEIDFERLPVPQTDEGSGASGDEDALPSFVDRADQGPRSLRLVEPEYPTAAQRAGVKARIVVEVKVDAEGNVMESRIVQRYLIRGAAGVDQEVAQLGYGLEEAALSAAGRWRFRPALHRGVPVGSFATLTFSFGV